MLRFILRIVFSVAIILAVIAGVFWLLNITGAWAAFLEGWAIATRNGLPWD